MKIENWFKSYLPQPYTPPEMRPPVICGVVYFNPKFPNGSKITTSSISHIDPEGNLHTASGSIYELGEPEEGYEQEYPNAKQRLFQAFSKT